MSVQVTNAHTSSSAAFKFKTNARQRYTVKPVTGLIPPGGSVSVNSNAFYLAFAQGADLCVCVCVCVQSVSTAARHRRTQRATSFSSRAFLCRTRWYVPVLFDARVHTFEQVSSFTPESWKEQNSAAIVQQYVSARIQLAGSSASLGSGN